MRHPCKELLFGVHEGIHMKALRTCGWKRGSMGSHLTGRSAHKFLTGQITVGSHAPGI